MRGRTALLKPYVWILGLAVFFVLVIVVMRALKGRPGDSHGTRAPLYAKKVLDEREQVLYWRLVSTFPDHVVLAQVALSQMLRVEKGTKNRQSVFNGFRQLCADFVICERDFSPLAVVELDGLSHDHPQRASADSRKAHAVESAGLTLIRINVADMPNEAALRAQLPVRIAKDEARNSAGTLARRG